MPRIEKTVFISYRRFDGAWALNIYQWLTQRGYDVFIDFEGIGSGSFESVIVENILSRAHFLVLLSPTALDRCHEPGDWLRREIELALQSSRNVVPIMLPGFNFGGPEIAKRLTGSLSPLSEYNGLEVTTATFDHSMERLASKFIATALEAVIHPPSVRAILTAREQQQAANAAIAEVDEVAEVAEVAEVYEPNSEAPTQPDFPAQRFASRAVTETRDAVPKQTDTWLASVAYVIVGAFAVISLLAARLAFERTDIGASTTSYTINLLHWVLPRTEDTDVVVLDISHLSVGESDGAARDTRPTPRKALLEIIEVLAELQPLAIGVNIDLSPTSYGWVSASDPVILERCLALSKRTPVAVGVYRSLAGASSSWLGSSPFSELAGGMLVPDGSAVSTPLWTRVEGEAKLPSLAARLVSKVVGAPSTEGEGNVWLQRMGARLRSYPIGSRSILTQEVFTDLSSVDQFQRETIRIDSPELLKRYRERINGSVVLIGFVDEIREGFRVPGSRTISGTLVQAASVTTLASSQLREIRPAARLALDVIAATVLLLAAAFCRRRLLNRTWPIVGLVAAVTLSTVYILRIWWIDGLLIALSLPIQALLWRMLSPTFGQQGH